MSVLKQIDDVLDPVLQAANKVRQVRDALPPGVWRLIPDQIKMPLEALFTAVENYDRRVGQLRDFGIM